VELHEFNLDQSVLFFKKVPGPGPYLVVQYCFEIIIIQERFSGMRLEDDTGWLNVAQREGVKLNCPLCPNLFTADRSFQVETRVNWDYKYFRIFEFSWPSPFKVG
jgi:hypothetical protein